MKIITVIGARPQFIKAAAVSRVLRNYADEILVHTGQYYGRVRFPCSVGRKCDG